nr:hypothetical protein [Achromobacter sp. DMS1]
MAQGDRILSIDGQEVASWTDARCVCSTSCPPADACAVEVAAPSGGGP